MSENNENKGQGTSGVSKISLAELEKIKAEMNGEQKPDVSEASAQVSEKSESTVGVSKLSPEELAKIRAEMNGEPLVEKSTTHHEEPSRQEQTQEEEPTTNQSGFGGSMSFLSGLLAQKRKMAEDAQNQAGETNLEFGSEPSETKSEEKMTSEEQRSENEQAEPEHENHDETDENARSVISEEQVDGAEPEGQQEDQDDIQSANQDAHESASDAMVQTQSDGEAQIADEMKEGSADLEFKTENPKDAEAKQSELSKKVPVITNLVSTKEEVVFTENDGTYTSNLDFTKNLSVRKTKLPLPKLPFILAGCATLIAALVGGVMFIVEKTRPPEPVVIVSATLNATTFDAGFVGDDIDFRGLFIDCEYSDGTTKRIYDVENYLVGTSEHFVDGKVMFEGKMFDGTNGYLEFVYDGITMRANTNTYAPEILRISDVQMEKLEFEANEIIKFADLLVFVEYHDNLGQRLLTDSDCKNYLTVTLDGVELSKSTNGFVITDSISAGEHKLVFAFQNYLSAEITIEIV